MLGDFRMEMQASWEAAASAEERAALAQEVSELLDWAQTATRAGRSHAQHKLIQLTRKTAYTAYS